MELKVTLHTNDGEHNKEVIERLTQENLSNKLGSYLKKFDDKADAEGSVDLKIDKNKTDRFNGVLQVNLDGSSYRYEREDYKNLDDLINHLFDHLKEELSK
jgi:hypothetical protein